MSCRVSATRTSEDVRTESESCIRVLSDVLSHLQVERLLEHAGRKIC